MVHVDSRGSTVRTTTAFGAGGALVAAVGLLAACGSGSSAGPRDTNAAGTKPPGTGGAVQHPASLVGVVGKNDAFAISLADNRGTSITHLAAGTYKLAVHDESGIHNFHLSGSGVDDKTPVPQAVTRTFTVTLRPGTYTFVCDAHPTQMKGQFTVS